MSLDDQLLDRVANLHLAWSNKYAEKVPTNALDHKAVGPTDYAEHHQDVSAAPAQENDYHLALAALLSQYHQAQE